MQKWERCLWIINTFCEYGDFSLKELNERFTQYSLNYDGEEISERTFNRDREFIASSFQIDIEYDARIRKYSLRNKEVIEENPIYRYLLSSFHINNLSLMAIKHKDKIMLQNPPTGVELLHTILNAIDQGRTLCFDYVSYYTKDRTFHFELIPAFVRLFEQRWYLIARNKKKDALRIYALDRIQSLIQTGNAFVMPKDFSPEEYFHNCFGIIHEDDCPPETVDLKVYGVQREYFRTLPLHHSQKEVENEKDYSVFRYYLSPTYDFAQEILSHGCEVEVLAPEHFRNEIREHAEVIAGRI